MKTVLFVCTGNTCRSPMAEGLFNKMLLDSGKDQEVFAVSGGVGAPEGQPASENAVKVMRNMGIDISPHRARQVSGDLMMADLILTMTKGHKAYILDQFPETRDRVFLLDEYVKGGVGEDIQDPFGGDEHIYRMVAEQIKAKLGKVLERLEKS